MYMVQENWTPDGKIYCESGIMLKFSYTVTNKRTYFHFYHVYPFSSNPGKKKTFTLKISFVHFDLDLEKYILQFEQ